LQSRLPDINTAFNTHRRRVIVAMDQNKFLDTLGALFALNALLPVEYRVIISTQKYNNLTRQDLSAQCVKCQNQIDYSQIKPRKIITTPTMELVSNCKDQTIWICPKCKTENPTNKTTFTQTVLDKPYYLGVVPDPPNRRDGLIDRFGFDQRYKKWCWQMLYELEEKMAQFRDDNWNRGEEEFDLSMINAPEEESDNPVS